MSRTDRIIKPIGHAARGSDDDVYHLRHLSPRDELRRTERAVTVPGHKTVRCRLMYIRRIPLKERNIPEELPALHFHRRQPGCTDEDLHCFRARDQGIGPEIAIRVPLHNAEFRGGIDDFSLLTLIGMLVQARDFKDIRKAVRQLLCVRNERRTVAEQREFEKLETRDVLIWLEGTLHAVPLLDEIPLRERTIAVHCPCACQALDHGIRPVFVDIDEGWCRRSTGDETGFRRCEDFLLEFFVCEHARQRCLFVLERFLVVHDHLVDRASGLCACERCEWAECAVLESFYELIDDSPFNERCMPVCHLHIGEELTRLPLFGRQLAGKYQQFHGFGTGDGLIGPERPIRVPLDEADIHRRVDDPAAELFVLSRKGETARHIAEGELQILRIVDERNAVRKNRPLDDFVPCDLFIGQEEPAVHAAFLLETAADKGHVAVTHMRLLELRNVILRPVSLYILERRCERAPECDTGALGGFQLAAASTTTAATSGTTATRWRIV